MDTDSAALTALDVRLQACEQSLTEHPDDVSILVAHGEAALLRGRLLSAMRSFQRLVDLEPDAVGHQIALGRVYLDLRLYREALDLVRKVLERAPGSIEGHILLRRLSRANGSVPSEIAEPLAASESFLPPLPELETERKRLEGELAQLDAEMVEHGHAVEAAEGDPVAEFSLKMTSLRRDRVLEAMAEVEAWETRHREIEEARIQAEEEERARREAEERARVEAEEAERRRLEEEERARREAEEAERLRLEALAREEEQRRIEEEERARREAEEAERQRIEEALRAQREAEEAERLRLEEEERARREAEEAEARRGTREREEAYARLSGDLSGVSGVLMKTKGVTAVVVMASDGFLVHQSHSQDLDMGSFSRFVVDALSALAAPGEGLGRWNSLFLEFGKGILVLQRVTADYYLVVLGQAAANFGVLTWTIDKNKAQIESVLKDAPPVPTL
jgi:predicted regulator of Ras-like GTPase activity (Roadblock/LC7/MglB family)